eukprot:11304958-Alexandrium_andersonii.AAC.1
MCALQHSWHWAHDTRRGMAVGRAPSLLQLRDHVLDEALDLREGVVVRAQGRRRPRGQLGERPKKEE